MSRRYLLLALGVLVSSAAIASFGRAPRRVASEPRSPAPPPVASVAIEIVDGAVHPEEVSIPSGRRVLLRVTNRDRGAVRFSLAGYEDRIPETSIAPGASFETAFTADRPGEDFAWLLGGEPNGRFAVTGSHLVEGHR